MVRRVRSVLVAIGVGVLLTGTVAPAPGGASVLRRGSPPCTIVGTAGNDRIVAGVGNDIQLFGGAGKDVVNGGAGNDRCVATVDNVDGNDKAIGGPGHDTRYTDPGDIRIGFEASRPCLGG